jgi:uncharacterized MnhB-related membrane protein
MALDLNFSSPHYAEAVELALGPVLFMSVATLLNTALATRLAQVTDRAKFLRGDAARHDQGEIEGEIQILLRRARLLHWAIRASSFGALMFAMVITLSFFAAFLQIDLSKVLAACFATALLSIVLALYSLLRETDVALNTLKL